MSVQHPPQDYSQMDMHQLSANWDNIPTEQRQALLDDIQSAHGGGFNSTDDANTFYMMELRHRELQGMNTRTPANWDSPEVQQHYQEVVQRSAEASAQRQAEQDAMSAEQRMYERTIGQSSSYVDAPSAFQLGGGVMPEVIDSGYSVAELEAQIASVNAAVAAGDPRVTKEGYQTWATFQTAALKGAMKEEATVAAAGQGLLASDFVFVPVVGGGWEMSYNLAPAAVVDNRSFGAKASDFLRDLGSGINKLSPMTPGVGSSTVALGGVFDKDLSGIDKTRTLTAGERQSVYYAGLTAGASVVTLGTAGVAGAGGAVISAMTGVSLGTLGTTGVKAVSVALNPAVDNTLVNMTLSGKEWYEAATLGVIFTGGSPLTSRALGFTSSLGSGISRTTLLHATGRVGVNAAMGGGMTATVESFHTGGVTLRNVVYGAGVAAAFSIAGEAGSYAGGRIGRAWNSRGGQGEIDSWLRQNNIDVKNPNPQSQIDAWLMDQGVNVNRPGGGAGGSGVSSGSGSAWADQFLIPRGGSGVSSGGALGSNTLLPVPPSSGGGVATVPRGGVLSNLLPVPPSSGGGVATVPRGGVLSPLLPVPPSSGVTTVPRGGVLSNLLPVPPSSGVATVPRGGVLAPLLPVPPSGGGVTTVTVRPVTVVSPAAVVPSVVTSRYSEDTIRAAANRMYNTTPAVNDEATFLKAQAAFAGVRDLPVTRAERFDALNTGSIGSRLASGSEPSIFSEQRQRVVNDTREVAGVPPVVSPRTSMFGSETMTAVRVRTRARDASLGVVERLLNEETLAAAELAAIESDLDVGQTVGVIGGRVGVRSSTRVRSDSAVSVGVGLGVTTDVEVGVPTDVDGSTSTGSVTIPVTDMGSSTLVGTAVVPSVTVSPNVTTNVGTGIGQRQAQVTRETAFTPPHVGVNVLNRLGLNFPGGLGDKRDHSPFAGLRGGSSLFRDRVYPVATAEMIFKRKSGKPILLDLGGKSKKSTKGGKRKGGKRGSSSSAWYPISMKEFNTGSKRRR